MSGDKMPPDVEARVRGNGYVWTMFTAAELMEMVLPPVKWVVPGLLPEGVTLLAGKPKLGKSWLGFGMAVGVASAGVVLGTKRVEQGEALYLALEDKQRRLRSVSASSWGATERRRAFTYLRRGRGLTRGAKRRWRGGWQTTPKRGSW